METVKRAPKKAGRPVKTIKKEIRACVRLTRSEHFIIKQKAKQAGVKPSVYLRQTAIRAKILPRLTPEEMQTVRQLVGMSNNMNQVAKVCHQEGLMKGLKYFEQYRDRVDAILEKMKP